MTTPDFMDPSAAHARMEKDRPPPEWPVLEPPPLPELDQQRQEEQDEKQRQAAVRAEQAKDQDHGEAWLEGEHRDRVQALVQRQGNVDLAVPSSNVDLTDRPHFAVIVEGATDTTCGQDGEPWPCSTWREHLEDKTSLHVSEHEPETDERARLRQAAALLGLDEGDLDTMLQRHESADR